MAERLAILIGILYGFPLSFLASAVIIPYSRPPPILSTAFTIIVPFSAT
jgi:hypothetical protein